MGKHGAVMTTAPDMEGKSGEKAPARKREKARTTGPQARAQARTPGTHMRCTPAAPGATRKMRRQKETLTPCNTRKDE